MRGLRWSLLMLSLFAIRAGAAPAGALFVTAESVDPKEPNFEAKVKKAALTTLEKKGAEWAFAFVGYLRKSPGATQVNLVFYDTADKGHEPVNAFPITTQPSAKIVASQVNFGDDVGLKAGHTYHVFLARLVGGKEEVYAKTTLTLK